MSTTSAIDSIPLATWRSLQCEWLWVYHGIAPRSTAWSAEIHVPPGVFFVETGRVKIRAGGKLIDVPRDHAFFSAPGPRRQWFAPRTRLLSVGFRANWPDGAPLYAEGLNSMAPLARLEPLHAATRHLLHAVHGRDDIGHREATKAPVLSMRDHAAREAAFQEWFVVLIDSLTALGIAPAERRVIRDARVQTVLARLDAWPLGHALDRDELFAELPVGARRLEQLFAEELQVAPAAYFERRRADAAREQLAATDISLKEVAHGLGFRHASHFTLWFRRHSGHSPSTYRRRYREGLA